MAEHLSDLELDELALGEISGGEARAHAQACERCRNRLAWLERARGAARSSPSFEHVFTRLQAHANSAQGRRRWWAFAVAPLAVAAILVAVALPRGEGDRIKGAPSLRLVRADGGSTAGAFRPGETVRLAVGAAGRAFVLVMAADASGGLSRLWPPDTEQSGPAPRGAEARLEPPFEVTPGSVTLFAFFSDAPLPEVAARAALEAALREASRGGKGAEDAAPALGRGETVVREPVRVAEESP